MGFAMKISFITDEVSQNFDTVLDFAVNFGFDGVELRSVEDIPIDSVPLKTAEAYYSRLQDHRLDVCCLASSFLKCSLHNEEQIQENMNKLNRLCDLSDVFGCNKIRGFTFFRDQNESYEDQAEAILERILPVIDVLDHRNKILLLESDPSVYTTNHAMLANFLYRLDSPLVGAIYDPGNDIYDPCGELPYPDGYDAIEPFIHHIHIKDAIQDENKLPQCVKIGTGLVDYDGLIPRLCKDGYEGYLSLETHYRIGSVITDEMIRLPQGSRFSDGGLAATTESALALAKLLDKYKNSVSIH